MKKPRAKAVVESMQKAYTQLRDWDRNGIPSTVERELIEPVAKTADRLRDVAWQYLGAKLED